MSRKILVACFSAVIATGLLFSAPAHAASVSPNSSMASFEGHTINLADGWGQAKACLAWRQRDILECFRTRAELNAREAGLVDADKAVPDTSCSSSLDLYSGSGFSGLELSLIDTGYWQELSYDGWDNLTVSYIGGACAFHLAQGDFGQGYWYPGDTGAWSAVPNMGSWDDTVSSVYID